MWMFYISFPREEFLFPCISHTVVGFRYFNCVISCCWSQVLAEEFPPLYKWVKQRHQWHLCGLGLAYLAVHVDFWNLAVKLFRVKKRFYATFFLWPFTNPHASNSLVSLTNFQPFRFTTCHLSTLKITDWRSKRKSTLFGIPLSKKIWRTVLDFTCRNVNQQQSTVDSDMF